MQETVTTLTAIVPPTLKAELQAVAREHERSMSGEVRLALSAHLAAFRPEPVERETIGSAAA